MVKPLKLTKTVTTGVLIASCITSTLPTHAFATQANAYADEFQAFVEGVENNKTDDAIADQAEQGTDQAAPVQPATPVEQTAPAPQTVAPAAPEQAAPQGEPAAPAEDVQASASPSAGVTEAAGKSDVAKKDEVAADKAAGEKDEAAAEVADKAEGVEPAAEIAASEAAPASETDPATETAEDAVENPGDVLGTVKELFPSESFRAALKNYLVFNSDEQELTREHLAKIETIPFDFGAGSFTIGKKDAESLGYMTGLETFSMPGNQMGEGSWKCDDIDALWNSISKMTNLTFLNLSNPNVADNANLKIKMPRLPKLKSLYLEGWTRSIFNGDAYSTKTYEGGSINSGNLPSLIIMRISGTKLDSWDQIGGLSNLQELHISHNGIQDLGFVRNLTKLTSFDAMSNMVTDFSPLKKAHGANLTSLTLINNRKYLVGDQAAVMMGGVDNIEIPVKYILPDGSPMGAGSLSLIAPNDKPAALGAKALPEGVTYDATKGVISITRKAAQNLDEHTVNGHKGKMLAIQFDADHGKGSSATGKVYVEVKVTNEVPNRAPVITAEDITVVQGNTVDLDKHATATDPDNDAVKITHAGEVKWNEPGTYKVTYTATDARGLSSTKEIKVTVKRKLTDLMAAPTIKGAKDIVLVEGDKYEPLKGVTATDSAGKSVEVAVTGDKVDPNKVGEYTITYVATDSNKLTSRKTVKVTVKRKLTDLMAAPTIKGAKDIVLVEGDKYEPLKGVTATDSAGKSVEVAVTGDKVDPSKPGTYTITYVATDSNKLTSRKTVKVTVKRKLTDLMAAPTIKGAKDIVLVEGDKYEPLKGVTATDSAGKSVEVAVTGDKVDPSKPGTYTITYVATDSNKLTSRKTVKVTVKRKLTDLMAAPTIKGAKDIVLVEGDKYEPLKGVTATDSAGKSVEVAVTGDKVDPSKPGTYTITYVATDSNKLTTRKTVTVTVNPRQLDLNAAPTFEGLSDKTIMLGDEFDPKAGVTAKDTEDGTIEFIVKGKVDSTKVGAYELTYTAKDSKGAAVTKVITVTVKQPVVGLNQAPTINAADVTIVQGETFDPMSGVTASDPEDGELKLTVTGTVDTEVYGEYELVYQAIDKDGAKATKTIKVIVLPRIVSLNAVPTIDAHSVTIVQGEAFDPMAGVSANDAEDGKLAVKLESGSVDTATPGEYILVYSATDSAGAKVTKTITVKVVAKQAEAGKPQKPGKPQQAGKPQKPGKPNGTAQLPQTGDASMVAAGATGLMGVLALAAERLRRRRK